MNSRLLNGFSLILVVVAVARVGFRNVPWNHDLQRLHVSSDPTRELYREIDAAFVARYAGNTGTRVYVEQSTRIITAGEGGGGRRSGGRCHHLGAASDIDGLARRGLITSDWRTRYPHDAQPYSSTIDFVVRKGNPKQIKDWPDLIQPGLQVVTPDPKTSGNGKLSLLAAWGSVLRQGGTEEQARDFVRKLCQNLSTLGKGARDSATTFALTKEGDVREVKESKGEREVIHPSVSIRAEPSVAWVDANVAAHKSEAVAQAYLSYILPMAPGQTRGALLSGLIWIRGGFSPLTMSEIPALLRPFDRSA